MFQTCNTIVGPIVAADIDSCLNRGDPGTCSAYIYEQCQYSGERRGKIFNNQIISIISLLR